MLGIKVIAESIIDSNNLPKSDGAKIPEILSAALAVFGAIAVIIVIYAGIQLIISQGNSEKVAQARRGIIYAIVGLLVIIFAQVLVSFISKEVSK